jgi:hypothetical protein
MYVTRGAERVTDGSVPDRRWEQLRRSVTEGEEENMVISTNSENHLNLSSVIYNRDGRRVYRDEFCMSSDQWMSVH